jgi:hypothetical protein
MRRRPVSLRAVVAAAAVSLLACDLFLPEVADDRLVVMAALNIDSAEHRVLTWPVYSAAEPPLAAAKLYRGTPHAGGFSWTLVAMDDVHGRKCGGQYLGVSRPDNNRSFCLVPDARLESGAAYMVEVSAEGFRTAWGHTLAVGDFEVKSAVLTRTGGSARLDASWTGSVAAHRYFVALRRLHPPYGEDPKGWYTQVDGTSATVSVPDYAIDEAVDPLILDVAAVSKELHAYLSSGTGGSTFSVPPVQNIENGFGFVGSMRVRSLTVESR